MWYPVITLDDEVSLFSCSIDNGWEAPENRCLWYGYEFIYLILSENMVNSKTTQEQRLVSRQDSLPHRESRSKLPTTRSILISHFTQNRYYNLGAIMWVPTPFWFYFPDSSFSQNCCFRFNVYGISLFFFFLKTFFLNAYVTVALFLAAKTNEVRSISQD